MNNDMCQTQNSESVRLRELARGRFEQDLPQLLRDHLGCWVAYHGDRQIAIARHTGELQESRQALNLSPEEVELFEIVSPDEEIVLGPMAFD
jgi:hypothetical protein